MRTRIFVGIVLVTVAASASTARAQTPDRKWDAWLGCWQLLEERAGDEAVSRRLVAARGAVVCVAPDGRPGAVRLTTTVENQSALEETLAADGARHSIDEPGCEGWQQAEWSSNGLRLYVRGELACGDAPRQLAGLAMIGADRIWTDVQVVTQAGRESVRVRRYRRAPNQARAGMAPDELARFAAATVRQAAALSIDEIKEATTKLPVSAVEAAIIETSAGFPLNRKRLIELADAGVPGRLVDLMVATSFPDHFVVEKQSASGGYGGSSAPFGLFYDDAFYDWPYYYAPFGYSLAGRYDTYYYGAPGLIIVGNGQGGGGAGQPQASGQGRVVDGFGYTRVRSREPVGTVAGGDSGGSSTKGGHASDGGSSSGGGSVTGGGYSSGGGGGGGRTAVSRPPG